MRIIHNLHVEADYSQSKLTDSMFENFIKENKESFVVNNFILMPTYSYQDIIINMDYEIDNPVIKNDTVIQDLCAFVELLDNAFIKFEFDFVVVGEEYNDIVKYYVSNNGVYSSNALVLFNESTRCVVNDDLLKIG